MHANTGACAYVHKGARHLFKSTAVLELIHEHSIFYLTQSVFYHSCLNFLEISMVEESSQPTKHACKILVSI